MKETKTATERGQRLAARRAAKKVGQKNQENMTKENQVKLSKRADKRSVSEMSPNKYAVTRKRTAFGDITNAIQAHSDRIALGRKNTQIKKIESKIETSLAKTRGGCVETASTNKSKVTITKPVAKLVESKEEKIDLPDSVCGSELISSSNENQSSVNIISDSVNLDGLLEVSISSEANSSLNSSKLRPVPDLPASNVASVKNRDNPSQEAADLPSGVRPYDTDQDPNVVSEYAESVFRNMKKRELNFPMQNYLIRANAETTGPMRAILVDWLVEVQENFELYHETLYLSIKLVDNYLQNHPTPKEQLQLIGATALLIACKIEERNPPPLDDFQFICDDAYTRKQFVEMEVNILKAFKFDINIPISYRFLRRYARVTSMSMQVLTLARYILELSLHEAQFVDVRSSKIAAASLCLALKMKNECEWDANFSYHTGYEENELTDNMIALNEMLTIAPGNKLQTVITKYSHPIFYEVAKIPPLDDALFF